jgi:adenosylcobinamide kinase/adenosylcobinamide-phosphate guanylyltransferase
VTTPTECGEEYSDAISTDHNRHLVVVLGGARSGKSAFAQSLTAQLAGERPVIYLATAQGHDDEMRARIAGHRAERPAHWLTLEEPLDPGAALAALGETGGAGAVVLDCVTLLVSNLLLQDTSLDAPGSQDADRAEARVGEVIDALLAEYLRHTWSLVLVTNEVGMGLVPPYPLGRQFRDILGRVNARLAQAADTVVFLVAGLPVELKALAAAWQRAAAAQLAPLDRTGPDKLQD